MHLVPMSSRRFSRRKVISLAALRKPTSREDFGYERRRPDQLMFFTPVAGVIFTQGYLFIFSERVTIGPLLGQRPAGTFGRL
jgi:hypothetical protein